MGGIPSYKVKDEIRTHYDTYYEQCVKKKDETESIVTYDTFRIYHRQGKNLYPLIVTGVFFSFLLLL